MTTSRWRRWRNRRLWRVIATEPHASGRLVVTSVRGKSVRVQLRD